jgi:hypothetical protein
VLELREGHTAVGRRGDQQAVEGEAGKDVTGLHDAMGSDSGGGGGVTMNRIAPALRRQLSGL